MKTLLVTCALFTSALMYSQETDRKPAVQTIPTNGGMTEVEKLTQQYESKTIPQRTLEGFVKGMERYDSGGNGAALGEFINKATNNTPTPIPKKGTASAQ